MYTLDDLFLNEWESIHNKGYGYFFIKTGPKTLKASVRNLSTGKIYTLEKLDLTENTLLRQLGLSLYIVKKETPQDKVNRKIKQMEQRYEQRKKQDNRGLTMPIMSGQKQRQDW